MQIIENYKNLYCDMTGRIFVEYDEIQELISKSRLQNDERPNTKDTCPMTKGLRLLNSNYLMKYGITQTKKTIGCKMDTAKRVLC